MKPTIGRIVHYTLSAQDVEAIGYSRGANRTAIGNPLAAGQTYPAMVVRVWESNPNAAANLQVLLDGNDTYWVTSRTEGTETGTWAWPPRT